MIKDILVYPDQRLKAVCAAIESSSDQVEQVVTDLVDTMTSFGHCVGIAAPQIGELVRIAIVDVSHHPKANVNHGLIKLINPRIVTSEGDEIGREGCLSIPDLTADIRRSSKITVAAEGLKLETEGFEARCIQHELDHLDGILFLDRVESVSRDLFRRKNYG